MIVLSPQVQRRQNCSAMLCLTSCVELLPVWQVSSFSDFGSLELTGAETYDQLREVRKDCGGNLIMSRFCEENG